MLVRKETLSYIFADLFQIWLNKAAGVCFCFCTHCVAIAPVI